MRVGIAVPQQWGDPAASVAELDRFLEDAEAAGFDGLWVQEQLLGTDPAFEPLTLLGYAAARTSRVRLGTAGVVAPGRSPVEVAKAFATLDQLSLGRIDAGLVLGEMRAVYDAAGRSWHDRGRRFDDAIGIIAALWRGGPIVHDSEYARIDGLGISPPPVQAAGPPLWLGGRSPRGMRRVARFADGWLGAGGASVADWIAASRTLDGCLEAEGRSGIRRAKKLYVWLGDDEGAAFRSLSAWFAAHWNVPDGDALARSVGVWGADARVLDVVANLAEYGLDTVILNPVGEELAHLHRFAGGLLPALQSLR